MTDNPLGLNREEPKLLPIEFMRPKIRNFAAMQFTGGEESAFELITWLRSNGIQATHWVAFDTVNAFKENERATAERVEYVHNPQRIKHIYIGDWLVHGRKSILNDGWEEPIPGDEFEVFTSEEMEFSCEYASVFAPVHWPVTIPYVEDTPPFDIFQPDREAIDKLKDSRRTN